MTMRRSGFTDEDDRTAKLLMAEFERVEHRPVTASWVATFADMARAVRLDREALHAELTAKRDRARATAVALEQQLARVERMAEMCERKAAGDREKVAAGTLTIGEMDGLDRRATNYEIVAQGLRKVLDPGVG